MIDKLNLRIGIISNIIFRGYSFCEKCRTNWVFVECHNYDIIDDSRGFFFLCKKCHKETSLEENLYFLEVTRKKYWKHLKNKDFEKYKQTVISQCVKEVIIEKLSLKKDG